MKINKLDKTEFLKKYDISEESFEKTTLEWTELENIYNDHINEIPQLESSAIFIFNRLMKIPSIHSVRYRIKDPEHLVEKIIRKRIENPDTIISFENYKDIVTDLIGLRALHLFKEDWLGINKSIITIWGLKQKPVANFRKGDSESYIEKFKENGCETKEHKFGYRSIHYIVETQPTKSKYFAEIQVRTIFEEAWSEIDHTIRYPYDQNNPLFLQFLLILNRLAGSADEMGTFVIFLKKELELKESKHRELINIKEEAIKELSLQIQKLKLDKTEKDLLNISLDKLKLPDFDFDNLPDFILPDFDFPTLNEKSTLSDLSKNIDFNWNAIDFSKLIKPKEENDKGENK